MFEYKILIMQVPTEEKLNHLGNEGWEHYAVRDTLHYFKRAKAMEPVKEEVKKNDKAKSTAKK